WSTCGMSTIGARRASACTAHTLVRRSAAYARAATTYRRTARRRAWVTTGSLPRAGLGLSVLDAEVDVGQGLQPRFLDRSAAPRAHAVGVVVHPRQGPVDLPQEVPHVVLDREVALALEREGAGVGVLVVEGHLAGEVRLRRGEGCLFDRR